MKKIKFKTFDSIDCKIVVLEVIIKSISYTLPNTVNRVWILFLQSFCPTQNFGFKYYVENLNQEFIKSLKFNKSLILIKKLLNRKTYEMKDETKLFQKQTLNWKISFPMVTMLYQDIWITSFNFLYFIFSRIWKLNKRQNCMLFFLKVLV
jgi:hypothetical protein